MLQRKDILSITYRRGGSGPVFCRFAAVVLTSARSSGTRRFESFALGFDCAATLGLFVQVVVSPKDGEGGGSSIETVQDVLGSATIMHGRAGETVGPVDPAAIGSSSARVSGFG